MYIVSALLMIWVWLLVVIFFLVKIADLVRLIHEKKPEPPPTAPKTAPTAKEPPMTKLHVSVDSTGLKITWSTKREDR